jgi:lysine 2,3-aminomutase
VLDIPGGAGKVPVGPCYAQRAEQAGGGATRYEIEDARGERHAYPPGR